MTQASGILRAACVQMCSGENEEANLANASALIEKAATAGCRLVVLPENFSFMSADDASKRNGAELPDASRPLAFLSEQAKRHGIYLIGGTVPLLCDEAPGMRNCCAVFGPKGRQIACYDKIHLFDVAIPGDTYTESAYVTPGKSPQTVAVENWIIGLSVCYDLRFPELYRHYAARDCQALTVTAAFTVPTGKAHWETLLRARAIENQCYVLAAAQSGKHPGGRRTWGHSMIIDPWGDVLAGCRQGAGLAMADMDLDRLQGIRGMLPALDHRCL
ncbi:MAG: carbon-nitrogen hydrolase family protein [Mariprofundaceae bacterium]